MGNIILSPIDWGVMIGYNFSSYACKDRWLNTYESFSAGFTLLSSSVLWCLSLPIRNTQIWLLSELLCNCLSVQCKLSVYMSSVPALLCSSCITLDCFMELALWIHFARLPVHNCCQFWIKDLGYGFCSEPPPLFPWLPWPELAFPKQQWDLKPEHLFFLLSVAVYMLVFLIFEFALDYIRLLRLGLPKYLSETKHFKLPF